MLTIKQIEAAKPKEKSYRLSDIADPDPLDLIKVIRLFEDRGAMERASKARRRCGEVYRYAIITGRAKYNPAPDLVDAERGYQKGHDPEQANKENKQKQTLNRYGSASRLSNRQQIPI